MSRAAELDARYFPGFARQRIKTGETEIAAIAGGSGPPLLLLHGAPQSHFMWHKVAGALAKRFTLVIPDLPGYGESGAPAPSADHAGASKRAMAEGMVEVMEALGFPRFAVAGHDRGGRVVHRMARDHGGRLIRAAVLDILPTLWLYQHTDEKFARAYWHWFFYIQPAPMPERAIRANAETTAGGLARALQMPDDMAALHLEYLGGEKMPHAMCEDYRAGGGIDLDHDKADEARLIECPLLVLWGNKGPMGRFYDVLEVWQAHARKAEGHGVDCGHFIPEEAPDATVAALTQFFAA